MTIDERLDLLTRAVEADAENIRALARIAEAHEERLDRLEASHERTQASIRALADEIIATQREWQAYLRRIPRQ